MEILNPIFCSPTSLIALGRIHWCTWRNACSFAHFTIVSASSASMPRKNPHGLRRALPFAAQAAVHIGARDDRAAATTGIGKKAEWTRSRGRSSGPPCRNGWSTLISATPAMISDCEVGGRRRQPMPNRPGWRPTDSGKRVVGQFEWSRPQISSGYLQEYRQMCVLPENHIRT